jgi:hypothetical protein
MSLLRSESFKVKYSSKNESKKLSMFPADLPAMMLPLQDIATIPSAAMLQWKKEVSRTEDFLP